MAEGLPRKSTKDPLSTFLAARHVKGSRAITALQDVEADLVVVRTEAARHPHVTTATIDALALPLWKTRRRAIRALVAAGMREPLIPFVREWLRWNDWRALQDLARIARRQAHPDPRLVRTLESDRDHVAAQIDAGDDDAKMRTKLRRGALHLSTLAQPNIARGLFLPAAIALSAAKKLRDVADTIRTPLVPGDRACKDETTAHRQRLARLNDQGLV
jgi:hypothetical protein